MAAAEAGDFGLLKATARDSSRDTSWRTSAYAFSSAAANLTAGALPAHQGLSVSFTFIAMQALDTGLQQQLIAGISDCPVRLQGTSAALPATRAGAASHRPSTVLPAPWRAALYLYTYLFPSSSSEANPYPM